MRRTKRALVALAATMLVVVMAAFVAGCGDDEEAQPSASTTTSTSAEKKPVRIFVLLPTLGGEAYTRQQAGMQAQVKEEQNVELTIEAGKDRGTAQALIPKLEAAITKQYDAIAINAGEVAKQLTPVLKRAVDAGIPVIAFDQDLPDLEGLSTYIAWDARQAGSVVGKWWRETGLPGGGKIGVIQCFAGNPLQDATLDGFKGEIKDTKIQIVSTLDAKCDVAKGRSAAENMMTAHPDLKGIFSDTDLGMMGAVQALKSKNGDLVLTGHGGLRDTLKSMTNGGIEDATSTFPFELFGRRAVTIAAGLARGEKPPPEVMIAPELVTKDNVADILSDVESYPKAQ